MIILAAVGFSLSEADSLSMDYSFIPGTARMFETLPVDRPASFYSRETVRADLGPGEQLAGLTDPAPGTVLLLSEIFLFILTGLASLYLICLAQERKKTVPGSCRVILLYIHRKDGKK